jgi:uncharacterized protein (DUF58 family)
MIPTLRAILLLIFAAPLIALATWAPVMQWLALVYLLGVLLLLVWDWRLAGRAGRFGLARQHDGRLSLGAENPVTLTLRNPGRRPLTFWVRDEPPDAFVVEKRVLDGQAAARQEWRGIYHVRPLRRGDYRFGDLTLRWLGPLGLMVRQERLPAAGPVKVYPNLMEVRRYDLLLRRNRLQEMGLRHSRLFGQGTEFERLRDYQPDDDYRRINWKATARRRRPVTVEYQTERSQTIFAVVDIGRMMQSPVEQIAKLDYVINSVLLLSYVVTGKGDKIGLMTFADQVTHFASPQQGRGQFYCMLEMLYAIEAQPVEPDYRRALSYLRARHRKRALVVIFTDLSGGASMNALVGQVSLLAKHSLPLVVTISDPDIYAAAHQQPGDSLQAYQRVAAVQLMDERRSLLEGMARQGVLTLDTPANQLSTAVINRYLELKSKTLI